MMRKFVVIATARRGIVKPREEVDDAGQFNANKQADADDQRDLAALRHRVTAPVRFERDAPLSWDEVGEVQPWDKVGKMLRLAKAEQAAKPNSLTRKTG
jgi:hypothetical protein